MPRVSVALPVYNGEPFLRRTLDDLRAQTEADWEAVVCDNASTDATADLLTEAAREDPRIRVVRNERNLGALPNANQAIERTTAPYVSLWGHDDRHHPDFLGALADALDATPGASLAYPMSTLVGVDDVPFDWDPACRAFRDAEGRLFDYDRGLEMDLPRNPVGRLGAVLSTGSIDASIHGVFRQEALLAGLPMTIHSSDRHVLATAALRGDFAYLSRPLFGFRIHPGSTCFLDPEAWAERETGGSGASRSEWRSLVNYVRRPLTAPIPLAQRASAITAIASASLKRRGRSVARSPERPSIDPEWASLWSWLAHPIDSPDERLPDYTYTEHVAGSYMTAQQ